MALNIKNSGTEALARELADKTGESLTEAVTIALRERLASLRQHRARPSLLAEIAQIQRFVREIPVRDKRSADAVLGYDKFGLPR